MPQHITFAMIKPNTVKEGHVGDVISMIEHHGFSIRAIKLTQLTFEEACSFYQEHREKSFYVSMCQSMTSGPVVAMTLQKENAVQDFRQLIGHTNPSEASAGTIRAKYGKTIESNAIHGSDAQEAAVTETKFFFPEISFA